MSRAWLLLLVAGCIETGIGSNIPPVDLTKSPSLEERWVEEHHQQMEMPAVDVLWVVDNSCSMIEEQTGLARNFDSFISYFQTSGLDWHIGVVSTDTENTYQAGLLSESDGKTFITQDTQNVVAAFEDMVMLGTTGSADEMGLQASWLALTRRRFAENEGFFRDEANLQIIVISDEDDHSVTPTPSEYTSWLRTLKPEADTVNFSAIVSPRPAGCSSASEIGHRYLDVVQDIGGLVWPICDTEWDKLLDELGLQASSRRSEFFLEYEPDLETLQIRVRFAKNPSEPNNITTYEFIADQPGRFGYGYDPTRNSVVLYAYVPPPGADIEIRYVPAKDSPPDNDDISLF